MSSPTFDPTARSTLTWEVIQLNNVYSSIFGVLCFWGATNIWDSFQGYRKKRTLIFLFNFLQTVFLFIKTVSATVYFTYFDLDCAPRGPLVNIPLVFAWDLIYAIICLKLLIFTPYPKVVIGTFVLTLMAHFAVVMAGVALRTTSMTSNWTCRDVYPLIYKQQYIIEALLEVFAIGFLIQGLASKQHGNLISQTQAILGQLRHNEHVRVFWVFILIAVKIGLSYGNPPFDTRAFTHFIDSARSALVCWALLREQKTVVKAVARSRQASGRPSISGNGKSDSFAKRSQTGSQIDSHVIVSASFGPIEEEDFEDDIQSQVVDMIPVPSAEPTSSQTETRPLQSDDTINSNP